MLDFHGIIFAYRANPALGDLVAHRTAASLPFCGRYRLIDLTLSSMINAGIRDVGVIMQRDYQSLLDHVGSGKPWDLDRKSGGLRILPPFGLPEYHKGNYAGTMEALNAVGEYIRDIPQKYVVLMLGDLCANINLVPLMEEHVRSGNPVTAICTDQLPDGLHHRYVVGEDGLVKEILFDRTTDGEGIASLEGYIINKDTLLGMMDACLARNEYRFHKDGLASYLAHGGKMGVVVHHGYAKVIRSAETYFKANMDMLDKDIFDGFFMADRPIRTKEHEGVSTFYGNNARVHNSLLADNSIIDGELENCIVFSGVRVGKGAKLKNCILMRGTEVGEECELRNIVADKNVHFAPRTVLVGSEKLPSIIAKGKQI